MPALGELRAHRVAYRVFVGEIPAGLTIDHLCRQTRCCNPEHLEAVTDVVNVLRGYGPPAINARKTHCINNHEFTEENTYRKPCGGRECLACRYIRNQRAYKQARKQRAA